MEYILSESTEIVLCFLNSLLVYYLPLVFVNRLIPDLKSRMVITSMVISQMYFINVLMATGDHCVIY